MALNFKMMAFASYFIKDTPLFLQVPMQLQPVSLAECSSQSTMTTSYGEKSIFFTVIAVNEGLIHFSLTFLHYYLHYNNSHEQ